MLTELLYSISTECVIKLHENLQTKIERFLFNFIKHLIKESQRGFMIEIFSVSNQIDS